jgi:hypothetical protein
VEVNEDICKQTTHMKITTLLSLIAFLLVTTMKAQTPTANFSISPNPVCSGSTNVITITDLSTGNPTSWSYTVTAGGPGPLTQTFSTQNPTLTLQAPVVYSVMLVATNSNGSSTRVVQTLTVLAGPNGQVQPTAVTTCTNGAPVSLNVQTGGGPGGGGVNTYSWSTGATSSSIAVNPSVTTVYTCVITATNGCTVTRTSTVTVGNPTVSIVSNPVNICPGFFSTLTANSSGSAPFTYTWSTAVNTKTETIANAGVYNVTVTTGNGCVGTQTISVGTSTALTASIAANSSVICRGNQLQLTGVGGTTYSWSTGTIANNINVNPTSTTVYSVIALTGTCQGTASFTVQVNVTPTLQVSASSTAVCSGNSATLNASGATNYTWTQSGSTSPSIVITPTSTSSGMIIYLLSGSNPGCPVRNTTQNIMVYTSPVLSVVASPTAVCAGEAMALSASGASTYSWSNGVNQSLQIVYPQTNASYTLTGVDANGCVGSRVYTPVVNECAGVMEVQATTLGVYPNPSTGSVAIKGAAGDFTITDLTGKAIGTGNLSAANDFTAEVNFGYNGIYFIQQTSGAVVKVIVVK